MTDEQAARLRALAEAATPGPWDVRVAYDADNGVVDPNTYVAPGYYDNIGIYSASADKWPAACDEYNIFERNDAAYIAAASPDVLLSLLDALDEARRERDEAKRDARELRFLWEQRGERANKAEDERDAAMALLRETRGYVVGCTYDKTLLPRIDAMLGVEGCDG